jgi:hypothetical protein
MALQSGWQLGQSRPRLHRQLDAGYEWEAVHIRDLEDGHHVARLGQGRQRELRRLLSIDGDVDVSRLTDHEVVDHVTIKLAQRQWMLFRQVLTAKYPSPARGVKVPASSSALSPSALWGRAPAAVAPPQVEPVSKPDYAFVQQGAQAATLRRAARDGVPFCEVCEKRAAERRPAASRLEAA